MSKRKENKMSDKKYNCVCWAKHYDGESFDIAGVTIYEKHKKPVYQDELYKELDADTFEGVIKNINNKAKALGGHIEDYFVWQVLPGGTHAYLISHWNEPTHTFYAPPKHMGE